MAKEGFCKNYSEEMHDEEVDDGFGTFNHPFVFANCAAGIFANVCLEGLHNYREHAITELMEKCNKECPYRNKKVFNLKNHNVETQTYAMGYEWTERVTKVKGLYHTDEGDKEVTIDIDAGRIIIDY